MERMRCILSYDGTNFSGYQIQANGRTVQEEIEKALAKMHKGSPIRITGSGRTDAGVHALGQVVHFDTSLTIPDSNWQHALNALLPDDIRIMEVDKVSNRFHARYDVREKEYRYFILNSCNEDVFRRNYTHHVREKLDIAAMKEACHWIEGEHDFTSFCATKTGVKGDKIRTIFHASCSEQNGQLLFVFKGSGFLYNMVRILVGTIVEIGKGDRPPTDMEQIIAAKDRRQAGKTAPAHGLFLWNVVYDN